MFYAAYFECPVCNESFCVDIDGSDCFDEPSLGDSVFCQCPKCKKLGGFEILSLLTEPEF